MVREIYYYIEARGDPRKPIKLGWRGMAFQCLRWLHANREVGYLGLKSCDATAEWAYWHWMVEYTFDSRGMPLDGS